MRWGREKGGWVSGRLMEGREERNSRLLVKWESAMLFYSCLSFPLSFVLFLIFWSCFPSCFASIVCMLFTYHCIDCDCVCVSVYVFLFGCLFSFIAEYRLIYTIIIKHIIPILKTMRFMLLPILSFNLYNNTLPV